MHLNFIFFHERLIFFNFRRSSFSLLRYVHTRMRKVRCRNSQWLHYPDAFGCRLLLWRWTQSKFLSGHNRYIRVICWSHWHHLTRLQLIHLPTNHSHLGKLCGFLHDQPNTQRHPEPSHVHNHVSPVRSTIILDHHGSKSTIVSPWNFFFSRFHYITVMIITIWPNYSRYVVPTSSPPSWLLR